MLLKIENEVELDFAEIPNLNAITLTFWIKVIPFTLSELNTFALFSIPYRFQINMNITTDIVLNSKIITINFVQFEGVNKYLEYNSANISLDEGGWQFYSFTGNTNDGNWALISNKYGTHYNYRERNLKGINSNFQYKCKLFGNTYTYITQLKIWNKLLPPSYSFYQKDYVENIRDNNLIGYWPLDTNSGNVIYNQINNKYLTIPDGIAFWDNTQKPRELLETGEIQYNNLIGNLEDYTYALEAESTYNIPIYGSFEHIWISFFYKTEEPSSELEIEYPGQFKLEVEENTILFTKIINYETNAKLTLNIDYSIGFNSWTHFLIGLDYSDMNNVAIKCQIIQCSTSKIQITKDRNIVYEYRYFSTTRKIQIDAKSTAVFLTHFTIWNQMISDMPNYYRYFLLYIYE